MMSKWVEEFPQLRKVGRNKYYKLIGPLLVGIELIKAPMSEGVCPYFVIYSLFGTRIGTDLKSCLSGPIILKELLNNKGLQFFSKAFGDGTDLKVLKKQLPISMEGNILLKDMLKCIDKYISTESYPNSFHHASMLEDKYKLVLCCGEKKEAELILKKIKCIRWDLKNFELFGIQYENWIKDLELSKKEELLYYSEINKHTPKLEKLYRSEFI